jgi:hypothetical protein
MAYTQSDLDAIDEEINGIRTVDSMTNGDRSTKFRSLDELYRERSRIAAAIAATAGTTRTRYVATSKGV